MTNLTRLSFLLLAGLVLAVSPARAQEEAGPPPATPEPAEVVAPQVPDAPPRDAGPAVTDDLEPAGAPALPEVLASVQQAGAATNTQMNYQGFIQDSSGPLNGSADFVFALFSAQTGGKAIWTESQDGVDINDGVYQVQLGAEEALTTDLFTDPVWLEITFEGTVLSPRTQLLSAPTAFVSKALELPYGAQDDSDFTFSISNEKASGGTALIGRHVQTSNWGTIGSSETGVFGQAGTVGDYAIRAFTATDAYAGYFQQLSNGASRPALYVQTRGAEAGRFADGSVAVYEGNDREANLSPDVSGAGGLVLAKDGVTRVDLRGAESSTTGSILRMYDVSSTNTVEVDAQGAGNSGEVVLYGADGAPAAQLYGTVSTTAGGRLRLYQNAPTGTGPSGVILDAEASDGQGAAMWMYDGNGTNTVYFDAQDGSGDNGGLLTLKNGAGTTTIRIDAQEVSTQTAGQITLYDGDGNSVIELDADRNGDGRVTTQELEITGGSDLAELFDVAPAGGGLEPAPGMVVAIDPNVPGALRVSMTPYDPGVAGVVSGAGGIEPGMVMGQAGTEAYGDTPVALTGRVYVWATAENGPILPGNRLTSSTKPGYAMLASDRTRADGATIGKAMTALEEGEGLVLLLVQF